ncbi:MAG: branched-chain amino acid transaminase [Longimicrobiales bacterium]|nr:branched-chain amino acid transaminase [Longimicrobiales bacterium]
MPEFTETDWIWKNGEFIPWKDAQLHVMSHVVHYGSSIFEGMRCYATPEGPAIFRLDEHIRRFYDSCKVYRMELPVGPTEVRKACHDLVAENELTECYIRPIAVRGYGAAGVNPSGSPIDVYLICWPWGAYLGAEALEHGVDIRTSSWNRPAPNTTPAMAKAGGNYINSALMKMEAKLDGYAEAIALAPNGLVSEGSGQNIFVVRDDVLTTPPLDGTLLAGITRDSVIRLAVDRGLEVRERSIPREALYIADELFFTGTAAEITPIRSVDRIEIGSGEPGPRTIELQGALLDIAQGKADDPYGWRSLPETTSQKASEPAGAKS